MMSLSSGLLSLLSRLSDDEDEDGASIAEGYAKSINTSLIGTRRLLQAPGEQGFPKKKKKLRQTAPGRKSRRK